jgi:diguanylate cyclase (GGDEF)-like protein
MKAAEYLNKQSGTVLFLTSIFLVVLIGSIDYMTGSDISSAVFYLLPVSLSTWFISRSAGMTVSLVSATAWLAADIMTRTSHLHPAVHFWNLSASFVFFCFIAYALSALKVSLLHEKELARVDSLSGLINRRYFFELAGMEINRFRRFGHPFTVAYIDIDDFKAVNDMYGHNEGDAVLRSVAAALKGCTREADIVARLGGDEFAVIFPETKYELARIMLPRLQRDLLEGMQKEGRTVTFSIGAVTFMRPPDSVEEMVDVVDKTMYSVKYQGKNMTRHEVFGAFTGINHG